MCVLLVVVLRALLSVTPCKVSPTSNQRKPIRELTELRREGASALSCFGVGKVWMTQDLVNCANVIMAEGTWLVLVVFGRNSQTVELIPRWRPYLYFCSPTLSCCSHLHVVITLLRHADAESVPPLTCSKKLASWKNVLRPAPGPQLSISITLLTPHWKPWISRVFIPSHSIRRIRLAVIESVMHTWATSLPPRTFFRPL
ncbi:hypothetical protein JB92DRAFT_1264118 [Gautieria morchelliformis]|nr:hypothetical protein JB92DRAFT_1264118 [Gautieria morchelliformis]